MNPFLDEDNKNKDKSTKDKENNEENKCEKYDENKMAVRIIHYYLDTNSGNYAKRAFAFGSTS
ncbi:hypothetical protein CYB53_08895, partial [Campylobacter coli]|nr:hypothetical protein [Campylobacter coli]